MPKQRSKSPEEYYKGLLREANKQIRELQKELKQHKKQAHMFEEFVDDVANDVEIVEKKKRCPDCGKGHLDIFEIIGRVFETCKLCGYRKKI